MSADLGLTCPGNDSPELRWGMMQAACTQRIPELVDTRRAAEILRRSPNTLKRWRYEGTGPDYVEIEGRISYDIAVLLEYIRRNTRVPSVRAAMEETRETV